MNTSFLRIVVRAIDWLHGHPAMRWGFATLWFVWVCLLRTIVPTNQQYDSLFNLPTVFLGTLVGFWPSATLSLLNYAVGWHSDVTPALTVMGIVWLFVLAGIGSSLQFTLVKNREIVSETKARARELEERIAAEVRSYRERDVQFRVLVEGIKDYAIVLLDLEGNVVTWNSGAERINGWKAEEIIGQNFSVFYPPDRLEDDGSVKTLEQARTSGHYTERGLRIRRDGTSFIAEVSITPLHDDAGLYGFAKITRDVTRLEEDEFMAAQQERTAAIGLLAAGMAHDFNNVLQVITVSASFISDAPTDVEMVRQCAARMTSAAARGAEIARRLLNFSRLDNVHGDGFEVDKVFSSIQDMIGPLLPVNIKMRVVSDADLPIVMADTLKLETVLVNLATNARDAMPHGGEIVLKATLAKPRLPQLSDDRQYIRLSIHDNGQGMSADTLAQVTEPFFTTKPRGHGTGLGLPMAKNYAERSGGAFEIDSKLGEYTEITLWLPTLSQPSSPREKELEPVLAEPATPDCQAVMVVDDDDLVRETIAASLQRRGMIVIESSDGEDALKALNDSTLRVDVLIVDYGLPGMSGVGVAAEARKLRPELPVLLITGNLGEIKLEQHARIKTLRKPFTPTQLMDVVSGLCLGDEKVLNNA